MSLTTRVLFLPTDDVNQATAHLFEHLLILKFFAQMQQAGRHPALFGWLLGETFQEGIFFDAGFYGQENADFFEVFLSQQLTFSKTEIAFALETIAAEQRSNLTITNPNSLQNALAILSNRLSLDSQSVTRTPTQIITQSAHDQFTDITFEIELQSQEIPLQKLFLRATVLITDIIKQALYRKLAYYCEGESPVATLDGFQSVIMIIRMRNGFDLQQLQQFCQSTIDNFDVKNHFLAIEKHFQAFANEPSWQNLPIEYFRHSNILTTNQEIAQLATIDNFKKVLQATKISLNHSNSDDFTCLI